MSNMQMNMQNMQQMMNMMMNAFNSGKMGGGFQGGNNMSGGGGGFVSGEVRYADPMQAQMAVSMLNGSSFNGGNITVTLDQLSKDGTKVFVGGLVRGTQWQELKDLF